MDSVPPSDRLRDEAFRPAPLRLLAERVGPAGLDLVAPLALGSYNREIPEEFRLPGAPDRLALVVGNTRALWPLFLEAIGRRPDLRRASDPLDLYVEESLTRALEGLPVLEARFAHDKPPRRVAIQRAADLAGMASLSPAHLSVHPVYGPWIALRAMVVLDLPISGPDWPAAPCWEGCQRPCMEALERALEVGWDPERTWRVWVGIRDACPRGRAHRYPEDALRYHYAGDRSVLAPEGLRARGGREAGSGPSFRGVR